MHREFIQKLTNLVEANLANESFGPEELAKEAGMSHSNLNRKLKAITIQNSSQFIREIRLKKARELLINEDLTVAEISYRVGFGSPTYFNNCFREYFGVAPGEMRNHKQESEPEEQPGETLSKKSNRTKLLIGLVASLALLIPLSFFLVNKYFFFETANIKDKSIAVLPFKYLSNDTINQYLADGMMDAILLNLSKIKDLRVISRTSVEQYRKSDKTAASIGREQDVAYLLEGSFQKVDNQIRLIVQLIRTKDEHHVWSDNYDRSWEDIFAVQSEVAEAVAGELQAVITMSEKQIIDKIPTTNLIAYDHYQRGNFLLNNLRDSITILQTRHYFKKALEIDSTFALAYVGLSRIYWIQYFWKTYLSVNFLDSVLLLSNKALKFDNRCSEAYVLKGSVFYHIGKPDEALNNFDKAIKLNPNEWSAYMQRGQIYQHKNDFVAAINNMNEALYRNRGNDLSGLLSILGDAYLQAGFPDLGKHYLKQVLELTGDTIGYLDQLSWLEFWAGNFEEAYQIVKNAHKRDSTYDHKLYSFCLMVKHYDEGYYYMDQFAKQFYNVETIHFWETVGIGFYNLKTGRIKEAEFYFNKQIELGEETIKLGRADSDGKQAQWNLAKVYAITGEKEKAYHYLDEVNKLKSVPLYLVTLFKHDPFIDNLREELRFKAILKDIETKHLAEHDRVVKWMAEQGML
jgi:TolB-like protein/AraC-like DNA-binding protein/Tfp pilus assembly protein PilF